MDDLLVIILTLIIAGVGVLGQIKKKKQEGQVPGTPETEPDIWEIMEGRPEVPFVAQEPEPEIKNYEARAPKTVPYVNEQGYLFKAGNEGGRLLENDLTGGTEKEKKTAARKRKKFPLRKAVIYSEILNRKYS